MPSRSMYLMLGKRSPNITSWISSRLMQQQRSSTSSFDRFLNKCASTPSPSVFNDEQSSKSNFFRLTKLECKVLQCMERRMLRRNLFRKSWILLYQFGSFSNDVNNILLRPLVDGLSFKITFLYYGTLIIE